MLSRFVNFFLIIVLSVAGSAAQYKSQCGQDQYFNDNFFKNKRGGVFIDIGAHDGETFSNTWFFEKVLDWKGICFEPMPDIFDQLVKNRNCTCLKGAVSDKEGYVSFRRIHGPNGACEMLSGIESKFDPEHIERLKQHCVGANFSHEFIPVYCYLLNNILEQYQYHYVDFLSLDTEGGELDILKSIDFARFYIYAITVENNYGSNSIREFLESKGFRYITKLEQDEVYINATLYQKRN